MGRGAVLSRLHVTLRKYGWGSFPGLHVHARCVSTQSMFLNSPLRQVDPEVASLIDSEFTRQRHSLLLIASENYAPQAVMEATGSVLTNKYAEGYPGARYYGGNEYVDKIERLCQQRALDLFGLDGNRWGVNVQALSGAPANFAVYSALLEPGERIMGLDLPDGGHLSHGYQTATRKVTMVSKIWQSLPYRLDPHTGLIDYEDCAKLASRFRPKILICGASAYARKIDFCRMKSIADSVNAVMMCDMAHIAGLVAARVHPSPFEFADIVTTTTHKTLRGPRGALIFYRKGQKPAPSTGDYEFEKKINNAVFPGLQGGPHEHTIAAIAVALKMGKSPQFVEYQNQVLTNCQSLAQVFQKNDIKMVSNGSDNHLVLIDLRDKQVTGSQVEKACEMAGIVLNKNTVPGDVSAVNPGGLRVGTPAMTSRGVSESDFIQIGDFIVRAIRIAQGIVKNAGESVKTMNEFVHFANTNVELQKLKIETERFASRFPAIGKTLP